MMLGHPNARSEERANRESRPEGRKSHSGAEARESSRSHARWVQAPRWESCSSIHHRAEAHVCTCAEAQTGRRGDRSTSAVYETRRKLNRCTRHRGKTQTEAYIRGPPLLHRPRPAINPRTNARIEQHASPSHQPQGPELPTEAEEPQCKHCRDASVATKKQPTG